MPRPAGSRRRSRIHFLSSNPPLVSGDPWEWAPARSERLTRLRLRPTSCRVHEADSVVEMAPVEPIGSIGIDPHIWTAQRSVGPEGPGQPEPPMRVPLNVAEVLTDHVVLEVESIDRMYLNAYVPQLQRELGVVSFFRFHRGYTFASSDGNGR